MRKKNGRFFYTLFYSLTFCFILILVKKTFCCYQHFFYYTRPAKQAILLVNKTKK